MPWSSFCCCNTSGTRPTCEVDCARAPGAVELFESKYGNEVVAVTVTERALDDANTCDGFEPLVGIVVVFMSMLTKTQSNRAVVGTLGNLMACTYT
jgi:hypothetical protein